MMSAVHRTKRTFPVEERVARAMSEAATSITITVLTDVLSFAVGIWTDFLAVQIFCIYIMLAMTVTFVYQLTFFLGVIVLSVRAEQSNSHTILTFKKTVPPRALEKLSLSTRLFCLGTPIERSVTETNNPASLKNHEGVWVSHMIEKYYAPFLTKTSTRIGVLTLYIGYLAVSIYGCYNVREGLDPSRLLVDDSYCRSYANKMEEAFWKEGVQAQVVFSNAGDLADVENRRRIQEIVNRFANSRHGMGDGGVVFWLNAFQNFFETFNKKSINQLTNETFYQQLDDFLSLDEHAEYRNDIVWFNSSSNDNNGGRNISAFRVLIGMHNFSTSLQQIETVDEFRKIAKSYPYYQLSTFEIMWMFVDQYESVLPNTLQEIYGGVSFMILIAIFFIPSMMCTFWVVAAILSIDAGAIGLMTFWGINLDVISMITIITSIGFSVDFTAHIAYAFVANKDHDGITVSATVVDRTRAALGSLAWPITQGAVSTTMGVVALSEGNSYIMQAFFKTIFIVMLVGFLHALIFLPVALGVLSCKLSTKYFRQILCCCLKANEKASSVYSNNVIEAPVTTINCGTLPSFLGSRSKEIVVDQEGREDHRQGDDH